MNSKICGFIIESQLTKRHWDTWRALNRIILKVAVDFCNTPLTLVESQDRDYTVVVPTHRDKIYPYIFKILIGKCFKFSPLENGKSSRQTIWLRPCFYDSKYFKVFFNFGPDCMTSQI